MRSFLVIGLACAVAVGVACNGLNPATDCTDYASCPIDDGGAPDGTIVDGGFDVIVPNGCDLTKSPKDSPECVDGAVAIFVSPTGSDSAAGSKELPVKTVNKGVELAASRGLPRVYVCEGTYAESVEVKAAVSIYGGFTCAWSHTGVKPKVQPSDGKRYALDVTGSNVTIEEMNLVGPETGAPNSIAVRVLNATNVVFANSKLEGRTGANGAPGTRTDFTGFPSQAELDGKPADAAGPGGENERTCPGGAKTKGGKGGASGFSGDPGLPSNGGGAGGMLAQSCAGAGSGGDGTTAPVVNANGASVFGSVANFEWVARAGESGAAGVPGQGGGGGQGSGGGSGGGGGAGGCGGAGGAGGGGGGASIAILTIASEVTLRASELSANKAGDGGAGIAGQAGQSIFGAGGNKFGLGCQGGNGGAGAAGGAGGGGAGGLSAVIVHKGTKPSTQDTTLTKGTAGTKGSGGVPGTNDGIDGAAEEIFAIP